MGPVKELVTTHLLNQLALKIDNGHVSCLKLVVRVNNEALTSRRACGS